jgi:hypothetical protein
LFLDCLPVSVLTEFGQWKFNNNEVDLLTFQIKHLSIL